MAVCVRCLHVHATHAGKAKRYIFTKKAENLSEILLKKQAKREQLLRGKTCLAGAVVIK